MEIFIFIIYLIFFAFIISIIPFFKYSGIDKPLLITLFFIKVFTGVAYAKFYTLPKYYAGSDTWRFYKLSLTETEWLLKDPPAFLKDLFIYGYNKSGNLFTGQNTYWNDLKSNVVIKLMAVINVFTNSSYYSNIIFFNFLFLFGLAALFKLLNQVFPSNKLCIIAGVFLLPSSLFWCSGIHKDGLILSATGVIIYSLYKGFKNRFNIKKTVAILLCMLIIFSLRNYIFFALIPVITAWWLSEKYPGRSITIFSTVYLVGIALCIFIPLFLPSLNVFSFISNKQHEFLLLEGGSKVSMPKLLPTFTSFVSFFPYAVDMAFLRPHFSEIQNISYLPAIAENLLVLFLLVLTIVRISKKIELEPVIFALFFFSISIMLLCGYTVPFTGAMVRYRSVVLPTLVTPLLCLTNFFIFKKNERSL